MRATKFLIATLAVTFMAGSVAHAAEYEVKTLNMNAHGMFQFDPSLVRIQPGDSVHFIAKDKGHDVLSIPGMLPDGAEPFKGEMNKDVIVTFTTPGVYGVECSPHYGMGMVALIVVGDPSSNLAKAVAVPQPGKAKQAFAKLFEEVTKQSSAAAAKP